MLNSYIFVIRKQNATRNCNVLFKFLYFGFLAPPNDQLCSLCLKDEDTQEHCLNCPKLIRKNENHLEYNDIFSSNESVQHEIANQFVNILFSEMLYEINEMLHFFLKKIGTKIQNINCASYHHCLNSP